MYKILVFLVGIYVSCKEPTSVPKYITALQSFDTSTLLSIRYGASYLYDLKNEVYTVYFMGKPPVEISFRLTDSEKKDIYNTWSKVRLPFSDSIFIFRDQCEIMPKIFTTIRVSSRKEDKEIFIDELCDDVIEYKLEAEKIKEFIKKVEDIMKLKPEILHAPKTNVIYL